MAIETSSEINPLQDFPTHRRWAVVGVSSNPVKFGNKIYFDLKNAGYDVYGVNPRLAELDGDKIYPTLKELPTVPDVVNVVLPPKLGEAVVDECVELGIQRIWFQPGAESDDVVSKAEAAGMTVVHNACIMIQKQSWD